MADCNSSNSNIIPSSCEFGIKQVCRGIQSLPNSIPTDISSDNVLFAFEGKDNCTSSDVTTLTEALHWIETNVIQTLRPCVVNSAPDCTVFTIREGKLTPVSVMQMLNCLPWSVRGQTILYTGSSVVIGFPDDVQTYSWLGLNDTTTSTGVLSYAGFAGGVPVVADDESGLVLQECLPVTSICPGTDGQVLTTIADAAGVLGVEWADLPDTQQTWLNLSDTFTETGDETTYAGTAGYIPIVNDAETGLVLSPCLPLASICPGTENQLTQVLPSAADPAIMELQYIDCLGAEFICPGTDGQLIQTLDDPNNQGTLVPQWIDCLDPQYICPGNDGEFLISRDDGTGVITPTWEPVVVPTTWLELGDTFTNTGDETTYNNTSGLVPVVNAGETGLELSCVPASSICPGDEFQIIQTLDDNGTLTPTWVDCLPLAQICPGEDGQVLETIAQADGTLLPTWVDQEVTTWLTLPDTYTGNIPEAYTNTAGLVPVVNDAEDGLVLNCVPASSICAGTDGQIIQTLDDPANPGTLVPQWIDCLDPQYVCAGADGQILTTVLQADGVTLLPQWQDPADGVSSWLELTDTFTETGDETTYNNTDGFIPIVGTTAAGETGLILSPCLPESSICAGTDGQIIQTLDDPANPGTLVPQWVDCIDPQYVCAGAADQVLTTVLDPVTNTLVTQWQDPVAGINSWLQLTDTFTETGDETTYNNTDGFIPIVGTTAAGETGLILSPCLPESSICAGTDGQIIQTLDDPANPGTLVPQWVDCIDPQYVCAGAADQVLTTVLDPVTNTLVTQWQDPVAGINSWLQLTDTFTETGDETTYNNTDGFIPIVGTTAAGETGLILSPCLPESSICAGTDGQIIQTLDDPANPGTLVPQWVDCLPVAQICPADDDCARLVSRNGTVQWVYDGAANLCDFYGQNDPNNNTIAEADIAAYYAGWEGATIRIREEGDGLEFVTQNDGASPPAQGQVLIHDFDDNGVLQTHYYTPIEFSVIRTEADNQDTYLTPGRNIINFLNPEEGENDGIQTGAGTVIPDATGTDPANAGNDAGYVITKDGRYNVCLRANIEVLVGAAQPAGTSISISPVLAILEQAGTGIRQEYRTSEVSLQVGQDQVDVGHVYTHFGSGCVAIQLSAGDVVQIRALVNPVRGVASYTQDPANPNGLLVTWGAEGNPTFSISEIPGYDNTEV